MSLDLFIKIYFEIVFYNFDWNLIVLKMAIDNNPLGLQDKIYSEKEFSRAIRNKFGTYDNFPDSVLLSIYYW